MVQITGNFVYYDGKFHKTLTYEDGPQEFDPSLEARLVREGTARYVGETVPEPEEPKPADDDVKSDAVEMPNLEKMTLKELKEYADKVGADVAGLRKKADIINAILDEEVPPTFGV